MSAHLKREIIRLHNQYEYEKYCCQRSLAALEKALEERDDCLNMEHHLKLLRDEALGLPITVIERSFMILGHIFDSIPSHVFAKACGTETTSGMLKRIFGHLCHITVLNPIYIGGGIIGKVMRVAAAAIGLFNPAKAVRVWQAAIRIDLHMLELFSNMWKWLVPNPSKNEIEWKYITPVKANSYFRGSCIDLHKKLIPSEELAERESSFREAAGVYFETLNQLVLKDNQDRPIWLELQQLPNAAHFLSLIPCNGDVTLNGMSALIKTHLEKGEVWDIKVVDHLYGCLRRIREEKHPFPEVEEAVIDPEYSSLKRIENNLKHLSESKDGNILARYHRL